MTIRGKASGVEVDAPPFWQVIEFRDGLISLFDAYTDPAAARQAAGLTDS